MEDLIGHDLDEDGEHEPDECYECLSHRGMKSECRCGACCRSLILEADLRDGEREPKIKELCSPIRGFDEQIGYLLNSPDGPCRFLDQSTNLCTIYETRPLMCRLFDCDGEGREQLIELGVTVPPRKKQQP